MAGPAAPFLPHPSRGQSALPDAAALAPLPSLPCTTAHHEHVEGAQAVAVDQVQQDVQHHAAQRHKAAGQGR